MKRQFSWLFGSVFLLLLALDQGTKEWARLRADNVEGYVFWPIWPGVFEFKLAYNYGIAFGLFQGGGVFFAPVAIVIAGGALWYSMKTDAKDRLAHLTLGMLAAGAVGNLIDRLWLGKVTDMFWFRLINFPVFNVADSCITVSAILLGILSLRAEAKAPTPASAETPDSPSA